jgi:GT2 family glycosyltransferase
MADPLVVVVAYRNTLALAEALRALGDEVDVLVVDNGAHPEVEALAEGHGAAYVTPGRNVGFAAAVNIGLARREGRDVLLLNPDARITGGGVRALAHAMEADPSLCAVGPALQDDQGGPQRVEWPIPSPAVEWAKALRLQRLLPAPKTFVVGAAILIRSEAIDDVGLMDERFFLYAEECDWQLRALRRGWKVCVAGQVVVRHTGGGSSEVERLRAHHFHNSARLFALKWYGWTGWVSMRSAFLLGTVLRLLATLAVSDRRARYARQLRR